MNFFLSSLQCLRIARCLDWVKGPRITKWHMERNTLTRLIAGLVSARMATPPSSAGM